VYFQARTADLLFTPELSFCEVKFAIFCIHLVTK
jgi:hypothetical protein